MKAEEIETQIKLEKSHFYFKNKRKLIKGILNRLQCSKILEIGTGAGVLSSQIRKKHPSIELHGVEIDKAFYNVVKQKKIFNQLTLGAFEEYKTKEQFDLIIMLDVLEHLQNDNEAVKKLFNLLSPKGHLVMTVPAYQFMFSYHDKILNHYRRYSRKALKKVLKENGMKVRKMTYFNSYLFPPLFLIRILFPNKNKSDTGAASSLGFLFEMIGALENKWIQDGGYVPFGTSLLAICQKE
mgnify:CR=1 FL=1